MAAIIANGGFLYRPSVVHHMTDEAGNLVVRNTDGRLIVVIRDEDGDVRYEDRQGNPVDASDVDVPVRFNEDDEYIFQPDVLNTIDVDQRWLDLIAEGMHLVNEEDGTGSGYVDWLDEFGVDTAGKTGTAEFCDNIAIERGWCRFEDVELRRILPTHSWYVGYGPYENPEIAVAAFVFNGDEGSKVSAPIVRDVMAAYFNVDQYAPQPETEEGASQQPAEEPAPQPQGEDGTGQSPTEEPAATP
jgi:penicillin-binding protein 2